MIADGPTAGAAHRGRASPNDDLFAAAVRLNVIVTALGAGLGVGLFLFLATHLSLAVTGDRAGRYLNLLGVFLPGYDASPGGAWLGLLWGTAYGGLSGAALTWLYARTLGDRLVELALFRADSEGDLRPPVLLLSGHAIGLALGGVVAMQLFLTTAWLILRGTAAESPHARLLANYLPGYDTTLPGALVGAAELFVLVYATAFLAGALYNRLARVRHGLEEARR